MITLSDLDLSVWNRGVVLDLSSLFFSISGKGVGELVSVFRSYSSASISLAPHIPG
jgi:hypothetical protein